MHFVPIPTFLLLFILICSFVFPFSMASIVLMLFSFLFLKALIERPFSVFLCQVHLFFSSALVERHLAESAIRLISAPATANKVKSGFSKTFKEKTFSISMK